MKFVDHLRRIRLGLSLTRRGPLLRNGWFHSAIAGDSIDATGEPLPWLTYPAIRLLQQRLSFLDAVFEYGAGNSTLFWAKYADAVRSVEHDETWYQKISQRCPEHVEIVHRPLGDGYPDCIVETQKRYDVIVVDGRMRAACLAIAPRRLAESGVIILDNSERPEYAVALEALRTDGFRRVDLVGPCPIVNFESQTSILYRDGNLLGL